MSFRSTQYLNPVYDDIDCETIDCTTATITNLTVTGTVSLPSNLDETVADLTVSTSLISQGISNLNGAVACGSTLVVDGTSTLDGTVTCGSTLVVDGASTLDGGVQCGSTLSVDGTSTLDGAVTCGSTIVVAGESTLHGAVQCSSTLSVDGISTLNGNVTCGTDLTVNGNVTFHGNFQVGEDSASQGNVIIANPYVYCAYNSNGVGPVTDPGGLPQMYGCLTGNYQVGQAEVDFWNIASGYNNADSPAFNFYKINNTSAPICWIQNNGQINCPTVGCSGTGYFNDVQTSSESVDNSAIQNLTCTSENVTNSNITSLTVNQNNQGGTVLYGGVTTYNSSTLAYNSTFGTNLNYLGYFLSSQLPSSVNVGNSSNLSSISNIFTFSSLPLGVYMCSGALALFASAGSTIYGSIVQAVQNNNTAIVPFVWNYNFNNSNTLTSNLNVVLPTNFMFYNNSNSGSLTLQISANYSGTFEVLGPSTSYLQLVRIA
jgi:cytoskeletal protein CcmA (bactofilin family)